jgi:hypothetical protein
VWIGRDRADVRLGAQHQAVGVGPLDAPGQLGGRAGQRVLGRLLLEVGAGQHRDVARPAGRGVVEGPLEPVARLRPPRGLGVVDGVGHEVGVELQEDVGRHQAEVVEGGAQPAGVAGDIFELPRWPQVRALLEQPDVDPAETQHRDELQRVVVLEQWEGEVGAGEPEVHSVSSVSVSSMNLVTPTVSHSAAAV